MYLDMYYLGNYVPRYLGSCLSKSWNINYCPGEHLPAMIWTTPSPKAH